MPVGCFLPLKENPRAPAHSVRPAGFAPARRGWKPRLLLLHQGREYSEQAEGIAAPHGRAKRGTCAGLDFPRSRDARAGAVGAATASVASRRRESNPSTSAWRTDVSPQHFACIAVPPCGGTWG